MATIWVHLCGAGKIGAARRKNDLAAIALYIAALLCKPTAVVLPLMIWMLDVVILGRPWKKSLIGIIPWLVIAGIFTALAAYVQPTIYIESDPFWTRPLVAADALAFYMAKLVLPINLAVDYGRSPGNLLHDATFHYALWWTWIFPVAGAAIVYAYRENRRLVAAAWIFLLGLLPVLGLTPFIFQYYSTVADRYVYVSMLGVALAAGMFFGKISRPLAVSIAMIITVILTGLSFAQAGVWKDGETLYQHDLALNNRDPHHWEALGHYRDRQADAALSRAAQAMETGDRATAEEQAQDARNYLQDAVAFYYKVLQLYPRAPLTYDHLSADLVQLHRMGEAIDVIHQWIALQPDLPKVMREDPAKLQFLLGMAYYDSGRYAEAADAFGESLKYKDNPFVEKHLKEAREKSESSTEPAATRP
jgi:hypothetical protein